MKSVMIRNLPKETFKSGNIEQDRGLMDNLRKTQKEIKIQDGKLFNEIKGMNLLLLNL